MVFLLSIWCLYILVNYYFRVYFNLKVILSPVIKPLPITVLLQKPYGDLNIWIRVNTSTTFEILIFFSCNSNIQRFVCSVTYIINLTTRCAAGNERRRKFLGSLSLSGLVHRKWSQKEEEKLTRTSFSLASFRFPIERRFKKKNCKWFRAGYKELKYLRIDYSSFCSCLASRIDL